MNSKRMRSGLIYVLLLVALGAFLYTTLFAGNDAADTEVSLGEVVAQIQQGEVEEIAVRDDRIFVTYNNNESVTSRKELEVGIVETLENLGVTQAELSSINNIVIVDPPWWANWSGVLLMLLPLLILGVFFFFILRQAQGAGNQAFSFGKSKARMFTGDRPTVTFDDVAGNDEAKQELQEVVEFLKEPQKFAALGARIPKGVLLVGPPGTGKTLMAKAVSGEAGVPFFTISGSEFVEMFVGVGASRVRDLFEQAKKNSPCIIFIDEIDAVGRHRGAGLGGSHDEREQTLNQILVEMDGFGTDTNVILVAATNRPDILDPALLRPGRFDRRVTMDAPDVKGRRAILDVHVRGKPLAPSTDLDTIAKLTPGFSGADIENMVNEGAILAARRDKRAIGMDELQEAIDRVRMGPERRSRLVTPREKEVKAFHEAGHGVMFHVLPNHDPVHKITIIPRGQAGGYAQWLPQEETNLKTREYLRDQLAALLGGRVAEEIKYGDITNGAANDLERVTNLARTMVTQLGMSKELGPIQYGQRDEMVFLGREINEQRNYSDKVAQVIDKEVRALVDEAYERCHTMLRENWSRLEAVVAALLEFEIMDAKEFAAIMNGEDPFEQRRAEGLGGTTQPQPQPDSRRDERRDDQQDSGIDLGGTVPAPA